MKMVCDVKKNISTYKNTLQIVPSTQWRHQTEALEQHTEEMVKILDKLLAKKNLTYENTSSFWTEFSHQIPIVHWELCKTTPGGISIYLLCRTLNGYDVSQFFSEMIARWILPGTQATLLSTKQLNFRFLDFPSEIFFVSEIFCIVEDDEALSSIRKNLASLGKEIALGAVSAHHARHILSSKALTLEQKTTLIHKTIIELSSNKFKRVASDIFFEMHHFLLACDEEFKRIRDVRHMCRIICYHNWFRKLIKSDKGLETNQQRQILFKLTKNPLHFDFGTKKVLGIPIAINCLKEYEQFEARHIFRACQRFLPNISIVPHSFFCYQNPSDSIHSFYIEIEKNDGEDFTFEELRQLRLGLSNEFVLSIEQLSHKLFMPQNEEEVLRNILILSHEMRYVKDIPQLIISFQGQSEGSLTFHVVLMRIVKDDERPLFIEELLQNASDLLTFIPGTKKIVGYVRNKYPKEAYTFVFECQKAPFLRQDHSVDLSRAREFVVSCIRKAIGQVRDFNGGLIFQQNLLLDHVKGLLTTKEHTHELYLENFFHSITPTLMRSLILPEHLKALFQLFISMQKEFTDSPSTQYKEIILENALCFMICAENACIFARLQECAQILKVKERELAYTNAKASGLQYFGCIFIPQEKQKIEQFCHLIQEKILQSEKIRKPEQSLKISLPRPTSILDPRVGTDRTSGIVIKMLYEGLMRLEPTGKLGFACAESVDISNDQKTYVFHLRDTKWSTGKDVTAYDFEYAWKKILDPTFKSLFAYLLYPIKNAYHVKKGLKPLNEVKIAAVDAKTLLVTLECPAPFFLELTSHWIYSPLCKEIDQLHPGWAYYGGDTFVCNGPFRLAKWKRNFEIQAIKNKEYWDQEAVQLQHIDISIVEDPKIAFSLYQKGELDWIGEPLSEIPPEIFKKKNSDLKIYSTPSQAVHWYACNIEVPPFTSKKCRKALAIALNRKSIIDELFQGNEEPAYSILPTTLSLQQAPYFKDGDNENARKLFLEGLEEEGIRFEDLGTFFITTCEQDLHRSIAYIAAKQWKQVLGLDFQVKSFIWQRYIEKCLQHDFHLMGSTWSSWYNDPIYNLEMIKYKSGDMNMGRWQHPEYVILLNKAQECSDHKMRRDYMYAAESIAMDEMPIIPILYYNFKHMKKDHLQNVYISHLGLIDFKWTSNNNQSGFVL